MKAFSCVATAVFLLLSYGCVVAQNAAGVSKPDGLTSAQLAGDYRGEIAGQELTLHLTVWPGGVLTGSIDHLDPQNPWQFALADIHLAGTIFSFAAPSAKATWTGDVSQAGKLLSGTWKQKGRAWLVDFVRVAFVSAVKPSPVDGIWLGTLEMAKGTSTRVQLVLKSDAAGQEYCAMDALDIYTMGMQCTHVRFDERTLTFDVPIVGGRFKFKLSADGNSLIGAEYAKLIQPARQGQTGTQAAVEAVELQQPLTMTRQRGLTPEKPRSGAGYDAALPVATAETLQGILDADLAETLKSGELAPSTGAGVTVGVYTHGARRIFSYGVAQPDSIYEIGSATKPLTGLILAQMAVQGKVKLDEPVRELLPAGVAAKPVGREITLLDLATQQSGLPAMPDNLPLIDIDQPYRDYHAAQLYAYLGQHGLANPNRAPSAFGALGFGLLGVALANRALLSYAALLEQEIAEPLGLKDTGTMLTTEQRPRLIAGRNQFDAPADAWESDALAGAIGVRSTAGDLLTILEAYLHPEKAVASSSTPGSAATESLAAALRLSLVPQPQAEPNLDRAKKITLGWLYQPDSGSYWHNGATATHSAYVVFNPVGDYAAVVLFNGSPGYRGSFAENLGRHISQRLAGKAALSLTPYK